MELKDLLGNAYKEGMTVEDINAALADISIPTDLSDEVDRLKAALTKVNSENANYKKELKSKMTDSELKEQEQTTKLQELQEKYDALLKESTLSKNKAELIALGYDDKLAEDTAKAMFEGDTAKVFANQRKFADSLTAKVKQDLIKQTPPPTGGSGTKSMTIEEISKIKDPIERQDAIAEHMDLYQINQ